MKQLEVTAKKIRRHIIEMIGTANSGHPGGSLSATEIVTSLYFDVMNIDPENPKDPKRDRFVLSKGHAAPVLYAALAEKGFFPVEELKTLRQIDSRLQGHPAKHKLPGIESSTGSLGQGISTAVGMALAGKLDQSDYRVFCLLGDGEIQEGQVWEAAMAAAHYKLSNLVAIVDNNGLQIDGLISDVLSPNPIDKKWAAFGWEVITIDGHDFKQIIDALQKGKSSDKPLLILAKTTKGKCISFMENKAEWHGKAPSAEQIQCALEELQ